MIKGRGKIMLISLIVLGVLVFAFCGFLLITNYRLGKIPAMTFQDTLEYVTKNDSKTIITVGIIKNGKFRTKYMVKMQKSCLQNFMCMKLVLLQKLLLLH